MLNKNELVKTVINIIEAYKKLHINDPVFEDISYIFQSKEFILFLEQLSKKYPKADLETDIRWAKDILYEKM